MTYVRKIRDIVAKMSPTDQRLFNLKFQFDFSDQDYRMWETISAQKHVKDPFTGSRWNSCKQENRLQRLTLTSKVSLKPIAGIYWWSYLPESLKKPTLPIAD